MVKTRLEILKEELDLCNEVLEQQFIERDIAMIMQDAEVMDAVNNEISHFIRRYNAIEELIGLEGTNGTVFVHDLSATITIH